MLGTIAAFEFRYQVRSPLFAVSAAALFLGAFVDMAVAKLLTIGGGNVLYNSPHSIIVSHLLVSLVFLFVGAAFVSNVIVRDDQTGFGPILRTTGISKASYLFGRFLGAFAVAALLLAAATAGQWLGTLMPFADPTMLGPHRLAAFAYGYGLFALPNALIICAILFALATATRSTAGTFVGVVLLLALYLVSQRLMEGQPQLAGLRVLADPLGLSAYMATSRYYTAAELNAGAIPITALMLQSRLLWVGLSIALLALTWHRFRFAERRLSRRRQRRLHRRGAPVVSSCEAGTGARFARLAEPRFDGRTARTQFVARAAMEARYILGSSLFLILLLVACVVTLANLLTASGWVGAALRPLTSVSVPIIGASFETLLVVIATYYGGELVWRERERRMHEIIDATALPAWSLMLPKVLGLALVLFSTLLVGAAVGMAVQLLWGGVDLAPGGYLLWYLLPGAVDALLIAALAVFVQALSPSKYAGWGVMVLYLALRFFGPSLGLEHPLFVYGSVPAVPLSDLAGAGLFWEAAWWFRLFWAATAVLLLVAAQRLWPRGAEARLMPRLRRMPARLAGPAGLAAAGAAALCVLSGAWIVYNTLVLNDFRTDADTQRYLAEYEKRFFRYARLPQPAVRRVELDVALYPEAIRAEVRGRYRLVNDTGSPIEQVHVRLVNRDLVLVELEFPAARLERDDAAFGYRIYRLDTPMQPGEARSLAFHTRREQVGFRAAGTETGLAPNGTDLDTFELTPRIGMSDVGLIESPAVRRALGLPDLQPLPRLDDVAATYLLPGGDVGWTTADITVSTTADQVPIAPGKPVSERVENGRRIVRFVSDTPIKNYFSIQSGRYAVRRQVHAGVEHAIYFHPAHPWNVDRMMTAMQASIDYYGQAFGPYQFDQARIVETPAYRSGAQAFANTIPLGETAGFAMDLEDPDAIDVVTMVTAHELAHQWWGHQVLGARMQGAGLLYETLAQYSALMVMKRLHGEDRIRRFLQFQLDRYLSGRRTQVIEEAPLVSVEISQKHVAYGKGALAMYLLQQRLGEDAVNRALKRFVDRYRFTTPPYPRSVDLVALLREEARTPEQQALITDLFERITLYDLKVTQPRAVQRADGRWDVTVPVEARKVHADGRGAEQDAPLDEAIELGLFTAEPGSRAFDGARVILIERQPVRSGSQVFRFVTDARPTHAGVDPYNAYIDRNARDNVAPVGP
ncbi:M1 family aminopeptidase [Dokdonella koreensis]|uniref:Aminopeptidase N n=1 Tax=Dokdonella koreensis DS-123 TaxID=1300342 RepID=A0A160DY07_9GAMM|nr:M1 family aminopeptidase [Dokdonella koreensis]ANB18883.1 Aminopeptidase N [Dokdonella koreensis DS-123]